jgi:hypothetical protein
MKALSDAIKKMAISMVIGQLEKNKEALAKSIASKFDIPFVKEEDEIALASGVLSCVTDVIEGLATEK